MLILIAFRNFSIQLHRINGEINQTFTTAYLKSELRRGISSSLPTFPVNPVVGRATQCASTPVSDAKNPSQSLQKFHQLWHGPADRPRPLASPQHTHPPQEEDRMIFHRTDRPTALLSKRPDYLSSCPCDAWPTQLPPLPFLPAMAAPCGMSFACPSCPPSRRIALQSDVG